MTHAHTPVLLNEVREALAVRPQGIYVDGTFGAGGYSRMILETAPCQLFGIDRDPDVIPRARELETAHSQNFTFCQGRFSEMTSLLAHHGIHEVDGIVLDIGVSSMQIDDPKRGFSFQKDGPLDVRMEQTGPSAADIVNQMDETDLADLIYHYGEERFSRRVARAIALARRDKPFTTTSHLADVVRTAVPKSADGIDPATRTFQALRIHVNDELGELRRALNAAEFLLRTGGILAIVTFHSLEDREVKRFFKEKSGMSARPSRHLPDTPTTQKATFFLPHRRAIKAGANETATNPRARSAKLRYGQRTAAACGNIKKTETPGEWTCAE